MPEPSPSRRRGKLWLALFVVPVVAAVLLASSFLDTMSHQGERLSGSNNVKLQQPVVQMGSEQTLCQQMLVPRDTASVLLYVAPTGPTGPPLTLTITSEGRQPIKSHIDGGWIGGVAKFAIPLTKSTIADANVCMRNDGRRPMAVSGIPSELVTVTLDGKKQQAAISVTFFRPGTETWWSLLPTMAHRAGVLKGSLGGAWGFWIALGLIALAAILSVGLLVRAARP